MDVGVKRKLDGNAPDNKSGSGSGSDLDITSPVLKKPTTHVPMLTNILVRPDYEIRHIKAGVYRFVGCTEAPPTRKSTDVKNLATGSITLASTTASITGITTPLMTLIFPDRNSTFPDDIVPSTIVAQNTTTPATSLCNFSDKTDVNVGILVHFVKSRNGGDKAVLKMHTKFPVFDAVRAASLCMRSYAYQYMTTTLLCGAFVSKPMLWLRMVFGEFYVKAVHAEYAPQWWQCICTCPLVLTIPAVLPDAWFSCREMHMIMVRSYQPSARVLAWIDTRHATWNHVRRATTEMEIARWQAMIDIMRKRTMKSQTVFVCALDSAEHNDNGHDHEDNIARACNADVYRHLARIPFLAALDKPVELYDTDKRHVVPATLFTSHRWTNHTLYMCVPATSEWTQIDQPRVASYVNTSIIVKPHHADRQGATDAIREIAEQTNPAFETVIVVTTDAEAATRYYYPVLRQVCTPPVILVVNGNSTTRIASLDAKSHDIPKQPPESGGERTAILVVDNAHCISQTTIVRIIEWIASIQGMHMSIDRLVLMLDPLFLAGQANQWATDLMAASYHLVAAGWKTTDTSATVLPGFYPPAQSEHTTNGLAVALRQKVYTSAAVTVAEMPLLFTIDITDPHRVFNAANAHQLYTHIASLDVSKHTTENGTKVYYVVCDDSSALDPVRLRTSVPARTCVAWHRDVFAWSENSSTFAVAIGDVLAVDPPDHGWQYHTGTKYTDRFITDPVAVDAPRTMNTNAKKLLPADADGITDWYRHQIAVVVTRMHVRAYTHRPTHLGPVLSSDEFINKLFVATQPTPLAKFNKKDADRVAFTYDMYLIEATVHDPVSDRTWQIVLYFKYSRAAAVATFDPVLARGSGSGSGTWGATATKLFTVYTRKSMAWRNISVRDPGAISSATLVPPTPTEVVIVVLGDKTLYALASVWTAMHTATKAVVVVCTNHETLETLYKPTTAPVPRIRSELGFPIAINPASVHTHIDDGDGGDGGKDNSW